MHLNFTLLYFSFVALLLMLLISFYLSQPIRVPRITLNQHRATIYTYYNKSLFVRVVKMYMNPSHQKHMQYLS